VTSEQRELLCPGDLCEVIDSTPEHAYLKGQLVTLIKYSWACRQAGPWCPHWEVQETDVVISHKVLRKLPPFDYQTKSELDELLETY
jgi:hypothetical protein